MQVLRLSTSARNYNEYTKKTKNGVLWLHLASFTLPIAKILSVKNVQPWVTIVSHLKKKKISTKIGIDWLCYIAAGKS